MVRHPAAMAAFHSAITCLAAARLSLRLSTWRAIRSLSISARLRARWGPCFAFREGLTVVAVGQARNGLSKNALDPFLWIVIFPTGELMSVTCTLSERGSVLNRLTA
jgi:hypothetical protein